MNERLCLIFLAAASLLVTVGCEEPAATVVRAEQPIPAELVGSPFDPSIEPKYLLSASDKLLIRYPTDLTLDQEVCIRSDGKISLPYVGDIKAAGRTPESLAAEINEKTKAVLQDPNVAVIVVEEAGRVVYVNGQVKKPGAITLRPSQTLMQSVIEAGGVTSLANVEQVLVLRTLPDDGTYILTTNLKQVLAGQAADIRLQPFDLVHIPETIIAQVDLFVDQYINLIIPRSVSFPFTTELHNEPVQFFGNNNTSNNPIQITR